MTTIQPEQPTIGERYILRGKIGEGGMGSVYRAFDRLTRTEVALKRVNTALMFDMTTSEAVNSLRLAITQEFRALASLHHPNIVGVLDYGFSADAVPFFTMELIEPALSLTHFSREATNPIKIELLLQMLRALLYVHRQNIVHHDLKPGNVVVTLHPLDSTPVVKILDFGLSVTAGTPQAAFGTLGYLAPEIVASAHDTTHQSSPRVDLYALGVLTYEMFTGVFPYQDVHDAQGLFHAILSEVPNYDLPGLPLELRPILDRLLEKDPGSRYGDAQEVIDDLRRAFNLTPDPDADDIRESFLRAARFVGRASELAQLENLLEPLSDGGTWLLGGESGAGKSRLLEEFRIRALVKGCFVLHGQATEGGSPYRVWGDPLRRLLLATPVSDLEAGILREIVPEIDRLLDRPIPPAPELPGAARLHQTVADLIKRAAGQPLVLLLEDIHWMGESLLLLKRIAALTAEIPLRIVGTYRTDEAPDIAATLDIQHVIALNPLAPDEVSALSQSIFGKAGSSAAVVKFLDREAEGNAFFLVEIARVLAEEAGGLQNIGAITLPTTLISGGIKRLLERRLNRLPRWTQPLLKRAAVIGRIIDLPLLEHFYGLGVLELVTNRTFRDWLNVCANSAVIEWADGHWRFSHDKLRDTLIAALPDPESRALHREVAEVIETAYPNDLAQAAALLEHWHRAGDITREAHYADIVSGQALQRGNAREVMRIALRTLERLPADHPKWSALRIRLGGSYRHLSRFEEAEEILTGALVAARAGGSSTEIISALLALGRVHWHRSAYAAANQYYGEALTLSRATGDVYLISRALNNLGIVASREGRYADAESCYQESLTYARQTTSLDGISSALNNLGLLAFRQGRYDQAGTYYTEALTIDRALGDRGGEAILLNNLGGVALFTGDHAGARAHFEASLAIRRDLGDRYGIAQSLNNLSDAARKQGMFDDARRYAEEGLALKRAIADRFGAAQSLFNLASLWLLLNTDDVAVLYLDESLTIRREIGDRRGIAESLALRADVRLRAGDRAGGHADLVEALALAREINAVPVLLQTLLGYARLRLIDGDAQRGAELLGCVSAHDGGSDFERGITTLRREIVAVLPDAALAAALARGGRWTLPGITAALI